MYKRRVEPETISLNLLSDAQRALLFAALDVRGRAWCPYSRFAVGAALALADGRRFAGCNVENASYGLSICAERSAVFAAAAAGMRPGELQTIVLVGGRLDPLASAEINSNPETTAGQEAAPITPCGACRQVLAEFAAPDCEVLCASVSGLDRVMLALPPLTRYRLSDLLPHAFGL